MMKVSFTIENHDGLYLGDFKYGDNEGFWEFYKGKLVAIPKNKMELEDYLRLKTDLYRDLIPTVKALRK